MTDQSNPEIQKPAEPQPAAEEKPPVDLARLVPVFEEMMLMLHESLTKIPHASSNLINVTKRNELVTTEVLSIVDRLNENIDKLSMGLSAIADAARQRNELKAAITGAVAGLKGEGAEEVRTLWDKLTALPVPDGNVEELAAVLKTIQSDSTSIIMSLQVQDITAQHIVAVNHLIESVQNRLTIILQRFYGADFQAMIPDSSRKRLANYIALISKKVHRQDILADNPTESQDDIDRMFKQF